MNIQIGTDVRVRFNLNETYFNEYEILKCYFVNVPTVDSSVNSSNISNHRFPREPRYYYDATEYELNCCGRHMYHTYPVNVTTHGHYSYAGFGVNSKQFLDNRPQFITSYLNKKYCHNYIYEGKYIIDSSYILAYFPAETQLFTGNYRFIAEVIVGGVVRTLNYGVVFTLVEQDGSDEGFVDLVKGTSGNTGNVGYIGFSDSSDYTKITTDKLTRYPDLFAAHNLSNNIADQYMWILSTEELEAVEINGVSAQMMLAKQTSEYYYYRSYDKFIKFYGTVIIHKDDGIDSTVVIDRTISLSSGTTTFTGSDAETLYNALSRYENGVCYVKIGDVAQSLIYGKYTYPTPDTYDSSYGIGALNDDQSYNFCRIVVSRTAMVNATTSEIEYSYDAQVSINDSNFTDGQSYRLMIKDLNGVYDASYDDNGESGGGGNSGSGGTTPTVTAAGYVGFSTAESDISISELEMRTNVYGEYTITNSLENSYLWIVSSKPINSIQLSNFALIYESLGKVDNFYHYRSTNKYRPFSGTFKIA